MPGTTTAPDEHQGTRAKRAGHTLRWLLRELPWFLGVLVGWWLLWERGYAFQPPPYIASSDWLEYLPSAWMVANDVSTAGYATWRLPGYLAMLGSLGEGMGYNEAGVAIASAALFVTVFATGLGTRALTNPWAALFAAAMLPLMKVAAQASRWITLYPCFTAGTALSFALGACVWRWPRLWIALLAGLACTFTLAMDWRGIQVIPPVLLLCGLGVTRAKGWQRWLLPVVCASVLWIGPAANQAVQVQDTIPALEQWSLQRNTEIEVADQDGLGALCAGSRRGSMPGPAMLADPCAQAFLAENGRRLQDFLFSDLSHLLLVLPLVLLPGRRGWSGSLASALVFGTVVAALLVMGLWARLNEQHFLQYAAFYVMAPAVGLGRLFDHLPRGRLRSWWRACFFTGLAAWNIFVVIRYQRPADDLAQIEPFLSDGAIILAVEETVGPDDRFMDCSSKRMEVAILPRRHHSQLPNLTRGGSEQACAAWLREPEAAPGDRWVLVDRPDTGVFVVPRDRWVLHQAFQAQFAAALFRWTGPADAASDEAADEGNGPAKGDHG